MISIVEPVTGQFKRYLAFQRWLYRHRFPDFFIAATLTDICNKCRELTNLHKKYGPSRASLLSFLSFQNLD